jgi:ferritin-like metal-binding protein YciE
MAVKSLQDLFHETLKDIYYVEKKLVRALPKMAKNAESPELREAIEAHLTETEGQVERLEQIFEIVEKRAQAKKCEAMDGILREADEVLSEVEDGATDAAIIASAQTVEHYEIARYGTLASWARQLGMDEAAELFDETLTEEKEADQKLSALAERTSNQQAAAA